MTEDRLLIDDLTSYAWLALIRSLNSISCMASHIVPQSTEADQVQSELTKLSVETPI
jgi:hypothetical protein